MIEFPEAVVIEYKAKYGKAFIQVFLNNFYKMSEEE